MYWVSDVMTYRNQEEGFTGLALRIGVITFLSTIQMTHKKIELPAN